MSQPPPIKLAAAIVCLPRSGSHMLASLLESHPQVGSFGEFVDRARVVPFPTTPLVIGIVMYRQWERAMEIGVEMERIIHLVRDPHHTAVSMLQNQAQKRLNGTAHRAHVKQGEPLPRTHPIDRGRVESLAAQNAEDQRRFASRLRGRDVIDVRYEAITGGTSIDTLAESESQRLLSWLGLPHVRLHTRYVKTGPIESW